MKDDERQLKNELTQIYNSKINVENITGIFNDCDISKKAKVKNLECTMMFVDIRNSTIMTDDVGRKNMVKVYKMFAKLVICAVEENFGKVKQIVGDGMLCVFVNTQGKKSSELAIKAGEKINIYLKDIYNKIVSKNLFVNCGIGIMTGHVYVTRIGLKGKNKCTQIAYPSHITNYASKFCDMAGEGEIICCERTYSELNRDLKNLFNKKKYNNDFIYSYKCR